MASCVHSGSCCPASLLHGRWPPGSIGAARQDGGNEEENEEVHGRKTAADSTARALRALLSPSVSPLSTRSGRGARRRRAARRPGEVRIWCSGRPAARRTRASAYATRARSAFPFRSEHVVGPRPAGFDEGLYESPYPRAQKKEERDLFLYLIDRSNFGGLPGTLGRERQWHGYGTGSCRL